jgi:hypothetical protein
MKFLNFFTVVIVLFVPFFSSHSYAINTETKNNGSFYSVEDICENKGGCSLSLNVKHRGRNIDIAFTGGVNIGPVSFAVTPTYSNGGREVNVSKSYSYKFGETMLITYNYTSKKLNGQNHNNLWIRSRGTVKATAFRRCQRGVTYWNSNHTSSRSLSTDLTKLGLKMEQEKTDSQGRRVYSIESQKHAQVALYRVRVGVCK